jgi:hypothetical protein
MEPSTEMKGISELSLAELFPETLTESSCVYIDKGREVWVGVL